MSPLFNATLRHVRQAKKQAGITLVEAMLGLAVLAFVVVAGVTAFTAVSERAEVNQKMAGLQVFLVDIAQYLQYHHTDAPGGIAEATIAGHASMRKQFRHTGAATIVNNAAVSTFTFTCSSGTPCPNGNTTGSQTAPNPNMDRFTSMPSLRYDDGDGDGVLEWNIPLGNSDGIDIAFQLVPGTTPDLYPAAVGTGTANGDDLANWPNTTTAGGCHFVNSAVDSDTAAIAAIPTSSAGMCENLSVSLERFDVVQLAHCADGVTLPDAAQGEVPIHLCFGQ